MTGNLRKRMLEEEHYRELNRIMQSQPGKKQESDRVVYAFSETSKLGDQEVTRSASVSLPDTAKVDVNAVLVVLRRIVQATPPNDDIDVTLSPSSIQSDNR